MLAPNSAHKRACSAISSGSTGRVGYFAFEGIGPVRATEIMAGLSAGADSGGIVHRFQFKKFNSAHQDLKRSNTSDCALSGLAWSEKMSRKRRPTLIGNKIPQLDFIGLGNG